MLFSSRSLLALALAASFSGCLNGSSALTEPDVRTTAELNDRRGVKVLSANGLEQSIFLETPAVRPGSELRLRSVLKNTSEVPLDINARICGFDVSTDLLLDRSRVVQCGGYSVLGTLSPGSSLTEVWNGGKVESPAGHYKVRVRHALEPELWTEAWITVRP
jgi:hypothetical protein